MVEATMSKHHLEEYKMKYNPERMLLGRKGEYDGR